MTPNARVALKVLGWFLLLVALVALGVLYVMYRRHVQNEIFIITGTRDEPGAWYGFWSGFAGGVRVFEWAVIAWLIYWHHTCQHSRWCLRPGRHQAAGGVFKLCRHHHPDLRDHDGSRTELIRSMHQSWKEGPKPKGQPRGAGGRFVRE